jgi:hypothetical protein
MVPLPDERQGQLRSPQLNRKSDEEHDESRFPLGLGNLRRLTVAARKSCAAPFNLVQCK